MKKVCLVLCFLSWVLGYSQAGFFGSNDGGVIGLSHNGGSDFNTRDWNSNLGSTHALVLRGGAAHTFKGVNGNICSATFHYRVFKQGDTPGAFTTLNLGFSANAPLTTSTTTGSINGNTSGDQRWQETTQNINLAALATSNGTWVLEVYFSATGSNTNSSGCSDTFFYNNSGNNYQILFNVVNHYGEFASAVNLKTCQSATLPYEFYNTTGIGTNQIGSTNFDLLQLGAFFQNSSDLVLQGGELKTFKENYANVCSPILHYRIYPDTSAPTGAFSTITIAFFETCIGCLDGAFSFGDPCNTLGPCNDQKWQTTNANIDLTNAAPGNYILEVYFEIPGSNNNTSACDFSRYVNNNGNNFKASFTIIPTTTPITSNP